MTATRTLVSLLPPERVAVGLYAGDKQDLLEKITMLASEGSPEADQPRLLASVLEREALISTGVGQGLALPHARTNTLTDTIAAFALLEAPVEYESLDGSPVRLVLLLAGPESERTVHLRLLSRVSRVMADAEVREQLLASESPREVLRILAAAEERLA